MTQKSHLSGPPSMDPREFLSNASASALALGGREEEEEEEEGGGERGGGGAGGGQETLRGITLRNRPGEQK